MLRHCLCRCRSGSDSEQEGSYGRFVDIATSDGCRPIVGAASTPPLTPLDAVASRDDFEVLNVLGRGTYGKVLQVRKHDSGCMYAMKTMKKRDVLQRNQVRHTLTEKKLLEAVQHPFIVAMHFAFQSETSLFLVLSLQRGGELFFHLRREGAFSEARVRLYAAEILLAIDALHKKHFVYRDLKPENVLLDGDGHARLTDFGLAKQLDPWALLDGATTFCGTPSYMAPEILLGSGHGLSVDWWSFGTLIYELLAGMPPFYSRNLQNMYRTILCADIRWPACIRRKARALIKGLLVRDPSRRLGSHGSMQIQRQPFFKPLNFRLVLAREYKPAFQPMPIATASLSQVCTAGCSMMRALPPESLHLTVLNAACVIIQDTDAVHFDPEFTSELHRVSEDNDDKILPQVSAHETRTAQSMCNHTMGPQDAQVHEVEKPARSEHASHDQACPSSGWWDCWHPFTIGRTIVDGS